MRHALHENANNVNYEPHTNTELVVRPTVCTPAASPRPERQPHSHNGIRICLCAAPRDGCAPNTGHGVQQNCTRSAAQCSRAPARQTIYRGSARPVAKLQSANQIIRNALSCKHTPLYSARQQDWGQRYQTVGPSTKNLVFQEPSNTTTPPTPPDTGARG